MTSLVRFQINVACKKLFKETYIHKSQISKAIVIATQRHFGGMLFLFVEGQRNIFSDSREYLLPSGGLSLLNSA